MDVISVSRTDFSDLAIEILQDGNSLRFRVQGESMRPFIRHGDLLEVEPFGKQEIERGDVILCNLENGLLVAHRVIDLINQSGNESVLVQGDSHLKPDGLVQRQNVLGRVVAVERNGKRLDMRCTSQRLLSWLWIALMPSSILFFYYLTRVKAAWSKRFARMITLLLALLVAGSGVVLILTEVARAKAPAEAPGAWASISNDNQFTPASQIPPGDPRLLKSDSTGIVIEFSAPDYQVNKIGEAAQNCQILEARNYGVLDISGQPALPVKGVMLGIPVEVKPELTILEADIRPLPGRYKLCPQSRPLFDTALDGQVHYRGEIREEHPPSYTIDQFVPLSPIELGSTGFIRSQAVIQLRYQPFQYNPVSGELNIVHSLRVKVSWPDQITQSRSFVDEGPFESVLRGILANYDSARLWRTQQVRLEADQPGFLNNGKSAYKISVDQDGLYQVTYLQLQTAGLPLGNLDPRTLRLFNLGSEVAITVTGETDGAFDPGDTILFYGQKTKTRYTDTNIYWLTWGNGIGRRMPTIIGSPGGISTTPSSFRAIYHFEQNSYYQPSLVSTPKDDRWYGDYLSASSSPITKTYIITMQNLATGPLTITLSGVLMGYAANPQHHTRILLNNQIVDDSFWLPNSAYTFTANLPQSYLHEGPNSLKVVLPRDNGISLDQLFVNWFEIEYFRTYVATDNQLSFGGQLTGKEKYQVRGFTDSDLELFDITMPITPSQVMNFEIQPGAGSFTLTFQHPITQAHRYLALSDANRLSPLSMITDTLADLRSTSNGADYILITHANFYTDVLPLAAWHQSQGLRVKVVDIQEIFDEFSAGVYYPPAIHDFLAYTYAYWQPPAPIYVLLVGDGNYDFKNFYKRNEPNYIPPYLADVDPNLIETAADNRFVTIAGDDNLPDMFLGRLPVKTRSEASAMVSKTLAYEQNPQVSGWISQTLFVADNADDDGDFAALSNAVADHYFPLPYNAQKVYYGVTHFTPTAVHTAILNAINQGRLIVNFVGHAYISAWAAENLFSNSDISTLTNNGKQPFMVPMTCLDGYFIHPSNPGLDLSSLSENIVRVPGKGAIGSFSPSGAGIAYGHDFLNRGLFRAIFVDDVTRLGIATTQAKLYLYANTGSYQDLLDTYLLFGDPALSLNTLPAETSISLAVEPAGVVEPGNPITYVLGYANTGPAIAHHVVISDVLSSEVTNPTVISSGAMITPVVGSRLAWQIADLVPGQAGVITITGLVALDATVPISNSAIITTTARDTNATDNLFGPLYTSVIPQPAIYLPVISR